MEYQSDLAAARPKCNAGRPAEIRKDFPMEGLERWARGILNREPEEMEMAYMGLSKDQVEARAAAIRAVMEDDGRTERAQRHIDKLYKMNFINQYKTKYTFQDKR
jgi:hypothetical protein